MIGLSATLIFAAAGTISTGQTVAIDGLQGLGDTRYHVAESEVLNKRLHVLVGLPKGYNASPEASYPTVYILDGGELYPLLKSYSNYLYHGGEAPNLMLVAISYGTDDWQQGNDRSHDYTAPTEEREHWGGAADFQAFLGDELLPFIESNYRSSRDKRIIFGHSLGGQFVLYSAQTQPGLFWGHIASNPALHRNLPLFLEMRPKAPPARSNVFVGDASEDDARFLEPRSRWIEYWTQEPDLPWALRAETLDGHNHFSAQPASFRRGIRWLFADELDSSGQ
jgi:predicted alpha/beta superfamily hydrolase